MVLLLTLTFFSMVETPTAQTTMEWYVPDDFSTIQAAMNSASVNPGDTIIVRNGNWDGAVVTKAVTIRGEGAARITDGPAHPRYPTLHYGFKLGYGGGGGGARITQLTFVCGPASWSIPALVFPIFAYLADDVEVDHCTFINPVQGISNWCGNGWNVHHNEIIDMQHLSGGGIGMFAGVYDGTTANNNVFAHNKVTAEISAGAYSLPGFALFADNRYGRPGGTVTGNNIGFDHADINGLYAVGIEVSALGLSGVPGGDDKAKKQVFGNTIIKNQLKNCEDEIYFIPSVLETVNTVEQNHLG